MARKAKTAIEADRKKHRDRIEERFRKRHPEIAKAERRMRKERADREKGHGRRDRLQDGGTPETRAKAAKVRQGSIARMYEAGHLTIDQLAASQQIRAVAERLTADVRIGTFSLETRVDQSRSGTGTFFERLGAVRAEVAYRRWSAQLGKAKAALAMILDEASLSAAAKLAGVRKATARKQLSAVLDLWGEVLGEVCGEIDEADVLAMHAGLI